jgi:cytidylate kinase
MAARRPIITIDGPAGSGKSTTARMVAERLGYTYLDTGAMYRAVTLSVLEAGIDPFDGEAIRRLLASIEISIRYEPHGQQTFLGPRNVSADIRSVEVSRHVSRIAALPDVRRFLVRQQQSIAREGGFVVDGRDAGTVIFPNAEIKFFLTATAEERARRRFRELQNTDPDVSYEETLRDLLRRDEIDSGRDASPLIRPPDAIELDNSGLTIDEQVAMVVRTVRERYPKP